MELRLTLKGPERLLKGRTSGSLREGTMVIGRSSEADWPIPDPERVVSKLHCRIEKDFDSYQLTDLSTNGVKVNETPVGYGLARRIEHGDVVKLGDAVLTVEIVATAPPMTAPPVQIPADIEIGAPLADAPVEAVLPDGPFGAFEAESPAPESAAGAASLPASAAPLAEKGMVLDDWWAPTEAEGDAPAVKPVDISPEPQSEVIGHIHTGEDTVWSQDTGVASLLRMATGLDVEKLAQAVEEAAAVLSAGERTKFEERLSEIVRNASGR